MVKINIQVANATELKEILEQFGGNTEVVFTINETRRSELPQVLQVLPKLVEEKAEKSPIPKKAKKQKHQKHSPAKAFTAKINGKKVLVRPWSQEDQMILHDWYMDPQNHYENGNMVASRLDAIAKKLGRSRGATHVKIITSGLNKLHVKGTANKETSSHAQTQVPPTVKVVHKFPEFKSVSVSESVLVSLFNQLTAKEGNTLKYGKDMVQYLGIESIEKWAEFVFETLTKSNQICQSLGRESLLRLGREGTDLWIKYSEE